MKLPIPVERFQKLDLRVGSVRAVRPHPVIVDLSLVSVALDSEVEAVAPASSTKRLVVGSRVIVARALRPLSTPGLSVTACLVPTGDAGGGPVLDISAELPDGSRLT